MPVSAFPEGFKNEQSGDWANIWPLKYIKPSWTSFGYRCTEWWAKWRRYPITLFALFGKGNSRWENDILALRSLNTPIYFYNPEYQAQFYLSPIQYWCEWHIQIGWPFFIAFHWYDSSHKVHYFRFGARRNAQGFYDCPSAHFGDWN